MVVVTVVILTVVVVIVVILSVVVLLVSVASVTLLFVLMLLMIYSGKNAKTKSMRSHFPSLHLNVCNLFTTVVPRSCALLLFTTEHRLCLGQGSSPFHLRVHLCAY